MSKRVTLTERDIELIEAAFKYLRKSAIINPEAYPHYSLAHDQRIEQITSKWNSK